MGEERALIPSPRVMSYLSGTARPLPTPPRDVTHTGTSPPTNT